MYDIWLAMNIVYEIAVSGGWVLPALALAVWAVLMWAVRRRLGARALRRALALGAVAALALVFALPSLTQSALSNLAYAADWAMLATVALGLAALLAALGLPLLAMLTRPAPTAA